MDDFNDDYYYDNGDMDDDFGDFEYTDEKIERKRKCDDDEESLKSIKRAKNDDSSEEEQETRESLSDIFQTSESHESLVFALNKLLRRHNIDYQTNISVSLNELKNGCFLRQIDDSHVNYLKRVIYEDPNWKVIFSQTPVIAAKDESGSYRIIEGNHRYTALIKYNSEVEKHKIIKDLKIGFLLDQNPPENEYGIITGISMQYGAVHRKPYSQIEMITVARSCLQNENFLYFRQNETIIQRDQRARSVFAKLFCRTEKDVIKNIRRFSLFSNEDFQFVQTWFNEGGCQNGAFWFRVISSYEKNPKATMKQLRDRFEHNKNERCFTVIKEFDPQHFMTKFGFWNVDLSLAKHYELIFNCRIDLGDFDISEYDKLFLECINEIPNYQFYYVKRNYQTFDSRIQFIKRAVQKWLTKKNEKENKQNDEKKSDDSLNGENENESESEKDAEIIERTKSPSYREPENKNDEDEESEEEQIIPKQKQVKKKPKIQQQKTQTKKTTTYTNDNDENGLESDQEGEEEGNISKDSSGIESDCDVPEPNENNLNKHAEKLNEPGPCEPNSECEYCYGNMSPAIKILLKYNQKPVVAYMIFISKCKKLKFKFPEYKDYLVNDKIFDLSKLDCEPYKDCYADDTNNFGNGSVDDDDEEEEIDETDERDLL